MRNNQSPIYNRKARLRIAAAGLLTVAIGFGNVVTSSTAHASIPVPLQPKIELPPIVTLPPIGDGDFGIACNEYCGIGHHLMTGRIRVID